MRQQTSNLRVIPLGDITQIDMDAQLNAFDASTTSLFTAACFAKCRQLRL
jgi:hypothetical protein